MLALGTRIMAAAAAAYRELALPLLMRIHAAALRRVGVRVSVFLCADRLPGRKQMVSWPKGMLFPCMIWNMKL